MVSSSVRLGERILLGPSPVVQAGLFASRLPPTTFSLAHQKTLKNTHNASHLQPVHTLSFSRLLPLFRFLGRPTDAPRKSRSSALTALAGGALFGARRLVRALPLVQSSVSGLWSSLLQFKISLQAQEQVPSSPVRKTRKTKQKQSRTPVFCDERVRQDTPPQVCSKQRSSSSTFPPGRLRRPRGAQQG